MYHLTCRWRLMLTVSLFLFISALAWLHIQDLRSLRPVLDDERLPSSSGGEDVVRENVEDFTAVVASLQRDDTSWLDELNWNVWRYEVDNPESIHKTPINKGTEAMVYLTHIIDQYDNLTSKLIFLHPTRSQWHNDDPHYDGLSMLKNLQLPYIDKVGYTSLRCHWYKGCPIALTPAPLTQAIAPTSTKEIPAASSESPPILDDDLSPEHTSQQSPSHKHNSTPSHSIHHPHRRSKPSQMDIVSSLYASAFPIFFPSTPIPTQVGHPMSAQFAVTRSVILARSKETYIRIRQWLIDVDEEDAVTGRVMEYMWHVLFGQDAVSCPDPKTCYCRLYGKCDVKCTSTEATWGDGGALGKVRGTLGRSKGDCGVYTYPFGWDWYKSVVLWKIARAFGW